MRERFVVRILSHGSDHGMAPGIHWKYPYKHQAVAFANEINAAAGNDIAVAQRDKGFGPDPDRYEDC